MATALADEDEPQLVLPPAHFRGELGASRNIRNIDYTSLSHRAEIVNDALDVLSKCKKGVNMVMEMEENLFLSNIMTMNSSDQQSDDFALVQLEHTLLQMGFRSANKGLCLGIFYCLPVKLMDGKYLIRYIETGAYRGFMEFTVLDQLAAFLHTSKSNLHIWKVYNDMDITFESLKPKKTAPSTLYNRLLTTNQQSVKRLLSKLERKLDLQHMSLVLHIYKGAKQIGNRDDRYTWFTSNLRPYDKQWDEKFTEFCLHGDNPPICKTVIEHIVSMATDTVSQELAILASLPNFHWCKYITIDGNKSSSELHIRFPQHLLTHPGMEHDDKGIMRCKHIPASPRNKVQFFLYNDAEYKNSLRSTVNNMLKYDMDEESVLAPTNDDDEVERPAKKRRKYKARILSVTAQTFCDSIGLELAHVQNCAVDDRTIYTLFCEQLVADGLIKWRKHSEEEDVVVMNDYSSSSGHLLPLSYVHVIATKNEMGEMLLKCSCHIYQQIQCAGLNGIELQVGEEPVLDNEQLTCMHCRFFKEELQDCFEHIQSGNSTSNLLAKIELSLEDSGNKLVLVGQAASNTTTKLSVFGEEKFSFIHITFNPGGCYAKCLNGLCQAKLLNKKKIPKQVSVAETDKLCEHFATLYENIEFLHNLFPEYFSEESDNWTQPMPSQEINLDDISVRDLKQKVSFNTETGLWQCPAVTKNKPQTMFNNNLVNNTKHWLSFFGDDSELEGGCYPGPDLVPLPCVKEGPPKPCECGAGYCNADNPQGCDPYFMNNAKVFTRNGVLSCKVFGRKCLSGSCQMEYTGEDESLFFLSSVTAAGHEIGWDFIYAVKTSKSSFTAFCKELTRKYQGTHTQTAHFMSVKTFCSWFFAWLASFQLDFRQEIDPWCKHDPPVLAGDGTHIGVSIKFLQLLKPITHPELPDIIDPKHKRFQRVLLPYPKKENGETIKKHQERCQTVRSARIHLKYICKKILQKNQDVLTGPEEEAGLEVLLINLRNYASNDVGEFLLDFVLRVPQPEVLLTTAKLVFLMCGDGALSSVFPLRYQAHLLQTCEVMLGGTYPVAMLEEMKTYAVEVADLLKVCRDKNYFSECVVFVQGLISMITATHLNDRLAPPSTPIAGSYNPASGTCYYFTDSGEQLREQPVYNINGEGKVYDNRPHVDDVCQKLFPTVSYGGFGYMYLIFCPIHGHCYGFHLIAGGEGRKDPFSAIFKYKPTAPLDYFYDFACQLSEFCLNREPAYWLKTRFWHDLFHGVTHKCGACFKSSRICGIEGINSEICEQFNSYMQCIKYTGSHLSQMHFMMFAQFMVYLWNQDKTKRFKNIAAVALAGLM